MDTDTAKRAATEIPLDEESFLAFTARTVFGINSDELGNPVTAALSSLMLFAAGALVPLMPWFFTPRAWPEPSGRLLSPLPLRSLSVPM